MLTACVPAGRASCGMRLPTSPPHTPRTIGGAPHYYLEALAVDVGRQRRGTGTALMQPILDRCDATGLPAWLETVNPQNLPLYERLGFLTVEERTLRDAGINCWLMVRQPPSRA